MVEPVCLELVSVPPPARLRQWCRRRLRRIAQALTDSLAMPAVGSARGDILEEPVGPRSCTTDLSSLAIRR